MSLVHRSDEIPTDAVALECHHCHARHDPGHFVFDDELRCDKCGKGGMVVRYESQIDARFPAPLPTRFTPLPDALMDHAHKLDLKPHEILVIWALERHRRLMGDEVWPSRDRLATLTRLSVHQVKRATSRLDARGLVPHHQPGARHAGSSGGRASMHYDLDPLWKLLAQLEADPDHLQSTSAPQPVAEHQRPQPPLAEHQRPQAEGLRTIPTGLAGDSEGTCGAPVHPEVDVWK